jgi:hypothetical protein
VAELTVRQHTTAGFPASSAGDGEGTGSDRRKTLEEHANIACSTTGIAVARNAFIVPITAYTAVGAVECGQGQAQVADLQGTIASGKVARARWV